MCRRHNARTPTSFASATSVWPSATAITKTTSSVVAKFNVQPSDVEDCLGKSMEIFGKSMEIWGITSNKWGNGMIPCKGGQSYTLIFETHPTR